MDNVRLGPVKGLRIAVAAFVLSVFLFIAAIGGGLYMLSVRNTDLANFSTDLRHGLIEVCERNGNPLRKAVQDLLREEIHNSESPVIRELFPQIPPALIEAQVRADRRRLREIAPVDCAAPYPSP